MRARQGCGVVALGFLLVVVACLVFAALPGAMILSGEIPLYAPRLTGLEPGPGQPYGPITPIVLIFDQPMDTASVEAAFSVEPEVPGSFQWNADRSQVAFVPAGSGFVPGTTYTVRLEPGVEAGTLPRTTARGIDWSFSLPPLVDTLAPPPGEENLGAWTRVEATFNYPLECGSTLRAFSITPQAVGVLECRDRTLAFNPSAPLAPDTDYAARLDQVFLTDGSQPQPGIQWQFRTAPPLTVVDVSPALDMPLTDLWTPIRVTFSRPVVADSVPSRLSLRSEDGSLVPGQITWEQDGTDLIFQPLEPLKPATEYQFTIESGVQDELGFELARSLVHALSTAAMVAPPSPAPDSVEVSLDSLIQIPFTRPMDQVSVAEGLTISPPVAGEVHWEEDTLVFTPRGGLAPETDYSVELSPDARDASGAPLSEPFDWAFSTEPFLLEVAAPHDTVLDLQQPAEFVFALPMDRASVEAALVISPTTPGDLVWSDDGRTVTFQPDPGWLPGRDYELTLSGTARTPDGSQALGEELTWTFRTGVAEVQFGAGPNIQVMAADGPRTFQAIAQGADVALFALYAITPTQFLDLYSSSFRSIDPWQPTVVPTTGLTPTLTWYEPLSPRSEGGMEGDWQQVDARIPGDVPPGLYILAAEPPAGQNGHLLVTLTQHALVLKQALAGSGERATAQVVAWDTEIREGSPVVSATVRLYDRDGGLLAQGQTGADGLLTLDVPGDPGPVLALSEVGDDVTVCGLGPEWSEAGWWWWEQPPSRSLFTTYSYTDRPIYRPGQVIYFKDWIRAAGDVSYTLPGPELPITMRLRDARDNVAATEVFTPTQFGTLSGQFQLAEAAMLGTWELETEVEGAITRQPLKVEEYRKPEYEVSVQTPQKGYVQGEPISVTVEAVYYLGQPAVGAGVSLAVYPVTGDLGLEEDRLRFDPLLFSVEGRTDAEGRWTTSVPTDDLFSGTGGSNRMTLALEATVVDASGQGVSSYQLVVVQRTSQGLVLVLDRHGYQPGDEITFAARVQDREGAPVADVELVARIYGWDDEEVTSSTAMTGAEGWAQFSLSLREQGWYRLGVRGLDDGGRSMLAVDYLWVYDPGGQAPWYGGHWGHEGNLTITADRATYAVGDEAQMVVYTATPGPALLTFERGETRDTYPVTLISGTNLITIPIRTDYAPNIYVKVSQFGPLSEERWAEQSESDAELHVAGTHLLVPMVDRLLLVTLRADQARYAPGDEATFHVQVTDRAGQPVVAEVSLAIVDEAIYALAEDLSQDPFEVFYGSRPNLVRTFDSLRPSRWLFPEIPGMGGGEGEVAGGAPRREFPDTAYWAPALVTDENGEAEVTLQLPDNLTEWRALARAVTTDTLVGQGATQVVVGQDIVVRPAVPRFLVQGDAITLTAVVQNFTTEPVSATVSLAVEGLTPASDAIDSPNQVVGVSAGGSAVVGWPVLAENPGEAAVTFQATAARGTRLAGRDSVEVSLPVHPYAVPEVTTHAGELVPAQPTETLSIALPADVITGLSRLEIDLASSLAPGLLEGLEYLIGYPYGCVEQTMSRVLPNAVVARAFRELGIQNEILEADLPAMVEQGLQRLFGYQHNDGGWGWWYDDDTDVNQTAYVLLGLSLTEQAGFEVDQGVMDRGFEALGEMLPGADPRAQAYGAYVLATAGEPLSITLTMTEALALDLFSQASLAIALDATGDSTFADALLDNLRESAIQDATTVHWEEAGADAVYSRQVMGSTVRTTAMVAEALVRLDAGSPLVLGAIRWLMGQRQGQGWGDTQRTSFAILALTDYLLAAQEQASGASFRVYVNGGLWQAGEIEGIETGETLVLSLTETISPGLVLGDDNELTLALGAEGERPSGRLYYGLRLLLSRQPGMGGVPALEVHDRSIGVQREYRLQGSEEPTTQFQRGDLVEVRLLLEVPEESWYLIVDDPLPAGFEALNERLGTSSHVAAAFEEPTYYWEEYGYNRKEVRDDRVIFYITHLEPGQQIFTYLARATAEGEFTALPAQVYPMYEPEVWSRAESVRLEVHPR